MFDFAFNAQRFAVYLIPTLLGIIMHEVAHGWMASRKGDQTARFMGRLTLNPVSHFDALGAAVFPVSYTHLDVYKRQPSSCSPGPCWAGPPLSMWA